jgi:hypothetical protein
MNQTAAKVWKGLPEPAKNAAKATWAGYARLTSRGRLLPDFIIIGTQRGGTTSLYKYLVQHPALGRALTKEVRYFDLNYEKGEMWYRSRFPSRRSKRVAKERQGLDLVIGEASPDYLFHPHAPHRVAELLPSVRLIVLLRDPVDRAHSHYWHQKKRGHETLSFEEAVGKEPERLRGELEKMLADETYSSYERHHHSYLARGIYVDQLKTWTDLIPREQFLIERSEDFFADPAGVFSRVLDFLDVPNQGLRSYDKFNAFTANPLDPSMRSRLADYFRPQNERLYEYLGRDLGWDEEP